MESTSNRIDEPLRLSPEELEGVIKFLEDNSITVIKERDPNYPTAKFQCRICDCHLTDAFFVQKHMAKHRKQDIQYLDDFTAKTLSFLPIQGQDAPSLYKALGHFLVHTYESVRLHDVEERASLASGFIQDLLANSGIEGIDIQYNGSSLSGFALQGVSAMDFSLQIQEVPRVKDTLHDVYSFLEGKKDSINDLAKDFSRRAPMMTFALGEGNVPCIMFLKSDTSHKTALLLKEYWELDYRVRVLGVVLRNWGHALGITTQKDTLVPAHALIILLLHYLIQEGVVPCIWEWWTDEENPLDVTDKGIQEKLRSWKTSNSKVLGELWVGFFKYYAYDFDVRDRVVTLCSSGVVSKSEKQWKYKRLSVLEPYCSNKNTLRVIHNTAIFEYIHRCFHYSCLYFGIPQLKEGRPLFRFLVRQDEESIEAKMKQFSIAEGLSKSDMVNIQEAKRRLASINIGDLIVGWNMDRLSNNTKMPVVCSVCTNEGHTQDSCPDEALPIVQTLPPLPQKNLSVLDKFFTQNMLNLRVTDVELFERNTILRDIMGFIRKCGYPTAVLNVYGSSENGFGFKNSDLDMCLTFEDHKSNDFDSAKVITDIAKIIQRMSGILNVRPITSAKVPIIKFFHMHTGLEGDISLYNCLASENTRLLRTYSNIDVRLQNLGYNLKQFIKACDFGDASRGSLSSYTCIIMAIYYLQHCEPPILPVLQELYDDESTSEPPSRLFEGYEVWFNSNPKEINDWKNKHPRNPSTAAELLIGFFDFFGRQFDSDDIVVSIRTHKTIKKIDKMWNTDCLAVEDPFELNRNLGGRLTRRMHLFIKKCFIKGYERFLTPMDKKYRLKDYDKYYFNPSNLGIGKAPTDRGCHICGGIWHVVRECPRKMFMKRRKMPKKLPQEERGAPEEEGVRREEGTHRAGPRPIKKNDHHNNNNGGVYVVTNSQLRESHGGNETWRLPPPPLTGGDYTRENHSGEEQRRRFIHGAIRLEDLERSFEPASSSRPPQVPPPGFLDPFRGVPPPRPEISGGGGGSHPQLSPNNNNKQFFPPSPPFQHQNFLPPTLDQKNALDRLLGTTPPHLLPPPLPQQQQLQNSNNLLALQRTLPPGYILPFGFREPPPPEELLLIPNHLNSSNNNSKFNL